MTQQCAETNGREIDAFQVIKSCGASFSIVENFKLPGFIWLHDKKIKQMWKFELEKLTHLSLIINLTYLRQFFVGKKNQNEWKKIIDWVNGRNTMYRLCQWPVMIIMKLWKILLTLR